MAINFKFAQLQPFSLNGSGAIIGDTTIVLKTMKDIAGNPLTMSADFGTIGFGTLEPGNGNNEEQISFTGITNNLNGTTTITGVSNVSFLYPYTQTSGLFKTHAGSTSFIISNTSGFYSKLASTDDDETINGIYTFTQSPLIPTGGTGTQAANATDIANAISGATGTATNLVFGTVKLDVAAVSGPNPIAVGSNSPLVVPTGTSGGIIGFTSTTARSSSVLLTQHALVVGGGAGATPTPVASLGTTTTLLHGNATGDPTFGAVVLTTDVSGVLPVANGGQVSYTNGLTTKNAADASTTQNIAHGLGRVPKKVRIKAITTVNTTTIGVPITAETVYNGTTQSSISVYPTASNVLSSVTTFSLNVSTVSGNHQDGIITFDSTNIIITWTLVGSPTGTFNILWEAEG